MITPSKEGLSLIKLRARFVNPEYRKRLQKAGPSFPSLRLFFSIIALAAAPISGALAAVLPDPSGTSFPDPNSYLTATTANAIVTSIGIGLDHRPYEPATALSSNLGMAMGIEATMVQPPSSLASALTTLSGSSSSQTVPILPSAKIHIRKSLGASLDIGVSFLPQVSSIPYFGSSYMAGGDIKAVIYSPGEGLTWALRGSYNLNNLALNFSDYAVTIKTGTIGFGLVVSKKLSFADPYLGMGLQYTYGSVLATVTIPAASGVSIAPVEVSQSGAGTGMIFFCGLDMRVPMAGFRLVLEGGYSPYGMNSLGTKIGFAF